MRFYFNQTTRLITDIKEQKVKSLLLYGSNQGMINWLTGLVKQLHNNVIELDSASSAQLVPALHATSLFNEPELVIYQHSALNKMEPAALDIIKRGQHPNFALWIADNLNTSSELYKAFESTAGLAIMSCYEISTEHMSGFISQKAADLGKNITDEALNYVLRHLQADPLIIESELTKLVTYLGASAQSISLADVQASLSKNIEANADLLFFYLVEGKAPQYFHLLDQLQEAAIPDLWIVRSLARYFGYVHELKIVDQSGSIEQKIMRLDPPVFFKYRTHLSKVAPSLSLEQATKALLQLAEIEISLKAKGHCGYQALGQLLISQIHSKQYAASL